MVLGAQFAWHRPEDTSADRLHLGIDQHSSIAVESDDGAVGAADILADPHHHSLHHITLLHTAARNGFLHGHHNDVADRSVFALRAAQHLDAHDAPRAGIVRHVEVGLHLNHRTPLCLRLPGAPAALTSSSFCAIGTHFTVFSRRASLRALGALDHDPSLQFG